MKASKLDSIILSTIFLSLCLPIAVNQASAVNQMPGNQAFNQTIKTATYGNWTYSNGSECNSYGLAMGSDGGYVITGYQANYPSTSWDAWLVKVDSTGVMQWNKTYSSIGADAATRIINCSDGGYAFTGYTRPYGSTDINSKDMWLVRVDANGTLLWMRTYGGPDIEYGLNLIATSDGGFLVVGCTDSYGEGDFDFYVLKTNSQGLMQWSKTFGYSGSDSAYGAVETADKGYVIAGNTNTSQSGFEGWLIKVDSNGNQIWNQTYRGPEPGAFFRIVKTSTGFTTVGTIGGLALNKDLIWLLNMDENGTVIWNRTYGDSTTHCFVRDFIMTPDEGYALTGFTYSPGTSIDLLLLKTDKTGNMEWNRTFGGSRYDEGWGIIRTPYGYALGGNSESYNNLPQLEYWFILTDSNGLINYNLTTHSLGQGVISPGNQTYMSGTNVNLVAVAADGWTFTGWNGDASGSSNTSITMNSDKTVTATFTQNITPSPTPPPTASPTPMSSSSSTPLPSSSAAPSTSVSPTSPSAPSPTAIPPTSTTNASASATPTAPELSAIVLLPFFFSTLVAMVLKIRNSRK